jgi:DNA-binding response OmpR family regulator
MSSQRGQFRIFVVDDEHVIASTTALILRHCGFDSRFFTSPLGALSAARSESPDLLISDVMMPQLTGVELALLIKAHCPACHVLLFSGLTGRQDLLAVARAQGQEFDLLPKPVHPDTLLRKVRSLMEQNTPSPAVD